MMTPPRGSSCSIIAVAGRRVDAADTQTTRFPYGNADAVRAALSRTLENAAAMLVVASAACGSDLLALDAASVLGIRTRIILPIAPDVFRETSVVDRPYPAYWGSLYDRLIAEARERGTSPFSIATGTILALCRSQPRHHRRGTAGREQGGANAARVQITEGPTLESFRNNEAIITWTSNNPGGADEHFGIVSYGTDRNQLNQMAKSHIRLNRNHSYTVFRVRVEGLKPEAWNNLLLHG